MRCCSTATRVAALRELTPSLLKMEATCVLTVGRLTTSRSAIWGLVSPSVNKRNTSSSRLAHGIRNEKLASERRSKEHVASTYRQDEGRKGEKREKNIDRVWQKNVHHR